LEKWPNFFIVGAPRAGTTTLYDYLKRTEGVFMSPKKEPHYFSQAISHTKAPHAIRDKKKYLSLFNGVKNEKAVGEASSSYLWDPLAPQLIHKQFPEAKIIIILRDPIERSFSNYYWRIGSGRKFSSFYDAIQKSLQVKDDFFKGVIIEGSWYYEQVKRYLDIFGTKQVKIIIFEEFIKEPRKKIKEILEFIDVDSQVPIETDLPHNVLSEPRGRFARTILQSEKIKKMGRAILSDRKQEILVRKVLGKKTIKTKMLQKDRTFLENLFREDAQKLQKLLKTKFPWNWVNR